MGKPKYFLEQYLDLSSAGRYSLCSRCPKAWY